jgi:hypothetical protein
MGIERRVWPFPHRDESVSNVQRAVVTRLRPCPLRHKLHVKTPRKVKQSRIGLSYSVAAGLRRSRDFVESEEPAADTITPFKHGDL